MHVHRLDVEATTLAVREWPGDGHALLAWHALGQAGSGAFLDVAAASLDAHGLRPLALDAPGFGSSPALAARDYDVERLATLLLGVLTGLQLERPVLLGHSWGAAVVLEAARRDPGRIAGVVLLDAGHADYADWPDANPTATLAELIEQARSRDHIASSWDALAAELADAYPGRDWILDFYREGATTAADGSVVGIAPAEVRAAALHGLVRARPSESWPALQAAGTPGLLMLATVPERTDTTNRRFVPALRASWPDLEIIHVSGATHSLFTELGADLGDLIGAWARRRGIT